MTTLGILLQKEWVDMWRNYKWLWLPLAFVIFGALQPIIIAYMPQILEAVGGLPAGAVLDFPLPDGGGMMAEVLGQFGTIGVLLLILAGMGAVAGEKQNRTAALVLVRPVSRTGWLVAKWAAYAGLTAASFAAGTVAGWYYTDLLIGSVPVSRLLAGSAVFALWLIFVISLVIVLSALLKSGATAVASLLLTLILTGVAGFVSPERLVWLPSRLPGHAAALLTATDAGGHLAWSVTGTLLLIVLLVAGAGLAFRRQEIAD